VPERVAEDDTAPAIPTNVAAADDDGDDDFSITDAELAEDTGETAEPEPDPEPEPEKKPPKKRRRRGRGPGPG
jgi:hypothetical protein